jgi:hypothetical protein
MDEMVHAQEADGPRKELGEEAAFDLEPAFLHLYVVDKLKHSIQYRTCIEINYKSRD